MMEKRLESPALKIRTDELLAFQRDLKQEKELLNKMLLKIDDQLHALQVEQLHILGLMNKSLKSNTRISNHNNRTDNKQQEDSTEKQLDLSVPSMLNYFDEEIEEDDEEVEDL